MKGKQLIDNPRPTVYGWADKSSGFHEVLVITPAIRQELFDFIALEFECPDVNKYTEYLNAKVDEILAIVAKGAVK